MRKSNGVKRLLLSYLPVFFIIVATLLFLAYLSLNEMSARSALKANTLLSHNIGQTIDDELGGLDVFIGSELKDNKKLNLFFASVPLSDRRQNDYEAAAALNEMMRKEPLIHSIYLYRSSDEMVLTPSSFVPLSGFGDKRFIGSKISSLVPFRWESDRMYRANPEEGGKSVVSLVKIANLSDRSLLVVNVSTESLSEMIGKMSESKLNFAELLDDSGNLIASKALLTPSGRPSDRPDGGKELAHVRSDYTEWSVRVGIYESSILDWVSSLFYVWISFGLAVIALGVVWFVFVTRRNYRPIQSWASRIEAYSRLKSRQLELDDRNDEFKYIGNAIDQLLDEHNMLQVKHEENIVYKRRHLFLQLLESGSGVDDRTLPSSSGLDLLGLDEPFEALLVVLFEIDQFQEFAAMYSRRDQQLLKQVIGNVVKEIAADAPLSLNSEWTAPHQFAALMRFDEADEAERLAVAAADRLREWIRQNLSFTVTAGIGEVSRDVGRVSDSYRSAQRMLGYKTSLGTNRLIVSSDLMLPQGEMFKQLQGIRLLCQAFRSGDPDWEKRLRDLYESQSATLYSRDELYNLFNLLAVHLHREMMELSAEFQDVWNRGAARGIDRIVERNETLEGTYKELNGLLRESFGQMMKLRETRASHQMLRQVKEHIEEQYYDSSLSLASVSERFEYNASYLSRIFKEQFGVNFLDYMTQIRIEKAIRLLRETELPIQDIAVAVGYLNSLSFIRAFKKQTGTTPGIYRKELPGSM